ncbi:MAG: ABC transporter permease [bacterium]|nr:ABC transporter permease [bacterium]
MRFALDLIESFRMAIDAIRANKARGALTTLGIIIGIVAVVLTLTAANGLRDTFRQSFSAVGSDVIYVSQMPWIMMDDFFNYRNRPPIDLKQARELESKLQGRAIVNPYLGERRDAKYRSEIMEGVQIIGTTEKQLHMSSAVPATGRFLQPFDVTYKKQVCVIGSEIREALFGSANPLNQMVKLGRTEFRVIGVMEEQGGSFFGDGPNFDRQITIPISSFVKAYGGRHGRLNVDLAVKAPSSESMEMVEYMVIGEMRNIRKLRPTEDDDFAINKLDTLIDTFNNMMGVVLLVGLLVTSISLFVGGVGVMNIMFVSVTERTREIGLRKAVGARRSSILFQFLFESAFICLLGGLIGILLSAALTAVINATLMPASVSVLILVIAVVVSLTVGVVAGFVPAYRGARLDPIEALRYE